MLASIKSAMEGAANLVSGQAENTKRARVRVVNNTTRPIVAISVIHKCPGSSNSHKSHQEWAMVQPGKASMPEMEVEYPAGSGFSSNAGGDSSWLAVWYSEDLQALWHCEPSESMFPVDMLDKQSREEIQRVEEALATGSEPGSKGAQLATALARSTTDRAFNSNSLEGLVRHQLRDEDANEVTELVINANETMTFKSKSGTTEAKVNSQPAAA
ncbi:TPA_exp: Uncharacterized protein A8136_2828 [Trichophyton benhamiae CBS 112371]|uniref:Up-regulated in Daf-2 domain-containing protein n=1 Tax=Arthroderma benhamiae (strain ATCC MYA-4681 / CBS 112371) TaxID=663331 RepID=D4ALI0_ARTBC|nr:uncharacterized protein ARB_05177 [Trichophyton benhamiae CBS 112371]EFE36239.1 hypothetical protein ARB_05177 [Trichophyton benhamiae CBS 112371]DAA79043.1 TPA_exp: Uncharacterized protein A8136_2828 [Trichophyton benhamiae CBS 112371]